VSIVGEGDGAGAEDSAERPKEEGGEGGEDESMGWG
jgi:hypothetical protein